LKSSALAPFDASTATPSTLKIHSADEIVNIPAIVGVPIDVIQQRARGVIYDRDDKIVISRGETFRGFIENKESLLDVIKKNWQQAVLASVTHAEIADHLNHIVEAARANPNTPIPYDPKTKSSDPKAENVPRFLVTLRVKEDDPDTDIFRPVAADKDEGASYSEAVIINTVVQKKNIRWTPVRERYIREFGFYSKGMDFETVLAVLFGKFR
ncbi:MAG TPA: hypothetical protein VIJ14_04890, partial [Rhabdochlamydiaceae bacterium]